jgi:hypothetical protein
LGEGGKDKSGYPLTFSVPTPLVDIEREMILSTLMKAEGYKTRAAETARN